MTMKLPIQSRSVKMNRAVAAQAQYIYLTGSVFMSWYSISIDVKHNWQTFHSVPH